jgi:hypothetical protein
MSRLVFMHILEGRSAHDDYFRSKTNVVVVILAFLLIGNVMHVHAYFQGTECSR